MEITFTARAALTAALALALLAAPSRADEDSVEARAKIGVGITLELSLAIKKEGFPTAKDSPIGGPKVLEKTFKPHVSSADARRAAACYAWGRYFLSTHKKTGQQVAVTLFVAKSPKAAQTLLDVMRRKELGMNKAIAADGIELVHKKMVTPKIPNTSGAYAYERVIKPQGKGPIDLTKLVLSSGRYVIEVALVGSKNKSLAKSCARAALVGLGLAKRAKK